MDVDKLFKVRRVDGTIDLLSHCAEILLHSGRACRHQR